MSISEIDLNSYFRSVIHYLAKKVNRNNAIGFDELILYLNIPKEAGKIILSKLWDGERYIDASADFKNPKIKINQKGLLLADKLDEQVQEQMINQFPRLCDRVLRFIVKGDKEGIEYNSKQISDELDIDYDTIVAIGDKLYEHELIKLSTLERYSNFHVLSVAHRFIKEQSFFHNNVTLPQGTTTKNKNLKDNVFIVHGRDDTIRRQVVKLLKDIGLVPIVLQEQPNAGKTIIEKFEHHSIVGFAIAILWDDDEGKLKGDNTYQSRARQNIILELGYFFGKYDRNRVCILVQRGLEIPSDILGIGYTEIDSKGKWKKDLLAELRMAGYQIIKHDNLQNLFPGKWKCQWTNTESKNNGEENFEIIQGDEYCTEEAQPKFIIKNIRLQIGKKTLMFDKVPIVNNQVELLSNNLKIVDYGKKYTGTENSKIRVVYSKID